MWLIIGWYPDNWYRTRDDRHNCTVEQLEEALEGHLTTEAVILHQENTTTDVGMVIKLQYIFIVEAEVHNILQFRCVCSSDKQRFFIHTSLMEL